MNPRLPLSALLLTVFVQGCQATTTKPPARPSAARVQAPRTLSDDELGPALAELLRANRSHGKYKDLATSIVRYQLARAGALFRADEREAGLRAVRGAVFLVQAEEATPLMWEGAEPALAEAAEEASRLGSEGQARAFYALLLQSKPTAAAVASAKEHLAAMDQFAVRKGGERTLEQAGDAQRVAVERSNYEPSTLNLDEAARKVADWIRVSLASDVLDKWGEAAFDRQEAVEAYRARRYGAITLVAAHLRHGNPMGALDWLGRSDLDRLTPPELRSRLEQAGEEDDTNAWGQLYQSFASETESNRAESTIGTDLSQAAAFGLAVELYRSRPDSLAAAGPLALMLPDFQLGDAVPELLKGALGKRPGREELSWALSLFMRAVLTHGDAGDLAAARRVFKGGAPILALAERATQAGNSVRPHPARLYRVMATLESRVADLRRARDALTQAVKLEPSALGYVELSRVERQLGEPTTAIQWLNLAEAAAKSSDDPLGAAEALTVKFELLTEAGDAPAAAKALRGALDAALVAREKAARPVEQAQAERRLARVLELYGQHEGATKATARALKAARSDPQQVSVTLLDAARRALVHDDLQGLRTALRDAAEYGLSGEDCTYVALWLRILELRRGLSRDGTVEEVLGKYGQLAFWPGKLRGYLLGQVTAEELAQAAHLEPQRIELAFYRAMLAPSATGSTRVTPSGSSSLLSEGREAVILSTAKSAAVGLIEVAASQDLLRQKEYPVPPVFPPSVKLP